MMKKVALLLLGMIGVLSVNAQNDIVGVWKAIDDKDGEPSSNIEIYEEGGEYKAKIIKVYDEPSDVVCEKCEGDKKDQPIVGLEIMWGMTKGSKSWSGGRILDPEEGNDYKCKITLNGSDKLNLRGYIGLPALGRTQVWHRLD